MRSFASDNNSGVHPLVMDAVIKANDNHAVGYGDVPGQQQLLRKLKKCLAKWHRLFLFLTEQGRIL